MIAKMLLGLTVAGCLFFVSAPEDKEVKPELEGVKCFLMPKKDVNEKFASEYNGAKVYFCCKGCKGKFEKDKDKYATKANQQLVVTKLYKQTACPISGGDLDASTEITVGKTKVQFCCDNCKAKAQGEKDEDKQAEMIFGKEAFKKGFEAVKAETEEGGE